MLCRQPGVGKNLSGTTASDLQCIHKGGIAADIEQVRQSEEKVCLGHFIQVVTIPHFCTRLSVSCTSGAQDAGLRTLEGAVQAQAEQVAI